MRTTVKSGGVTDPLLRYIVFVSFNEHINAYFVAITQFSFYCKPGENKLSCSCSYSRTE